MHRFLKAFDEGFIVIVFSFIAACACLLIIEEWRATKAYYFLGALLSGILIGIAAQQAGVPQGWDILVTGLAVVTAPTTISAMRHQTLVDTIDAIQKKIRREKRPEDKPPD